MENNQMTIPEVLELTARTLNEMTIPVKELDTIGRTIFGCAQNIQLCIDAMKKAEEEAATDGADPDPE